MSESSPAKTMHFIREIIAEDRRSGKYDGKVVTRFPPEPNGYLHIGHAKAICLDFGMAMENGATCHLRMDDTNPVKEDIEYTQAIQEDVRWLGFDWGEHFFYASDYFDTMYELACTLIRDGNAYVCALTAEQWKEYRGTPTEPGRESPCRNRPPEESLALFERMRKGEIPDGELVLRAKIDMASPNLHMRDPVLYRILHAAHPHTGDKWCIYPMYDFAHPIEDAIEQVTHSLCTLEFEVHRPLYDWVIAACKIFPSRQIEFARLSLTYTVMSKRKLLELVQGRYVNGWDDPRMPTLSGMRRRGIPPAAIREFCERIGVTKYDSLTDVALLEHCVRDELNHSAQRVMAVLEPLRLVIENPEDLPAAVFGPVNPENPEAGEREIPFEAELFIERGDFEEVPPPKYFRLSPGASVRLRYAGFFTCTRFDKEADGRVSAVYGRFTPMTEKVKVKATIHWVPATAAKPVEVRLYDRLFSVPEPDGDKEVDFKTYLNPDSLKTVTAMAESSLLEALPGDVFQFERLGYFAADPDSMPGAPVFNRTVTLKDSWKVS
ncbi:MAG: glutamine--tRNA ligase/YqeY domain fusion protein [Verrucomicrobiota bacterium]|jgi:glutaminyl-tRNA synthetase|nr:glutamine--tRNA ligase/YqeY domain fusion protein [Verrucomicrobiota bacterium]